MTSTGDGRLCSARTVAGAPCRAYAGTASAWCFTHDPQRSGERNAARSKGGRARHGRAIDQTGEGVQLVRLGSMADALALVERAARDALRLENSLGRARCLGYLASIAVKAVELAVLEARVDALEQRIREGPR